MPGGYKLLAHLYAAESLILQDKVGLYNVCVMHIAHTAGRFHTNVSQVGDALVHLDPDLVTSVEVGALVPITLQNSIPSCSLHY